MRRGNIRKFGRERNQRKALSKALITALINNGKIKTTQTKAKALSIFADKLVTHALKNDLSSRKVLLQFIGDKAAKRLVSEISPKFKEKNGGYTRVIKLGQRKSDGAPMVLIEFMM